MRHAPTVPAAAANLSRRRLLSSLLLLLSGGLTAAAAAGTMAAPAATAQARQARPGPRPRPRGAAGAAKPPLVLRALLVGVARYPALPDRDQLGCDDDVATMTALLTGPLAQRERVRSLQNEAAKNEAVRTALAQLLEKSGVGDVLLFYFSGRGSLALTPDAQTRHAPTLALHDSTEDSDAADLPLDQLADWVEKARDAGRHPVVILDTCFVPSGARSEFEMRLHNSDPRSLPRPGLRPRATLWRVSVGQFLCAADIEGLAYEAKRTGDAWAGVFTDALVNRIARSAQTQQVLPTPRELVEKIVSDFTGKTDSTGLLNFHPYDPAAPIAGNGIPLFATVAAAPVAPVVVKKVPPPKPPAPTIAAAPPLRLAVNVAAPRNKKKDALAARSRLVALLAQPIADREIQIATGGPTDRVLTLTLSEGLSRTLWKIQVTGSELEANWPVEAEFAREEQARDWFEAQGVGYLRLQAHLKWLWDWAETQTRQNAAAVPPPPSYELRLSGTRKGPPLPPGKPLGVGEGFFAGFSPPDRNGWLFLLERHGEGGAVRPLYPAAVPRGWMESFWGDRDGSAWIQAKVSQYQPVGPAQLLAIYVPNNAALPPLAAPEEREAMKTDVWQARLLAQLEALRARQDSVRLRIGAATYEHRR